jgi:hypothetical protein
MGPAGTIQIFSAPRWLSPHRTTLTATLSSGMVRKHNSVSWTLTRPTIMGCWRSSYDPPYLLTAVRIRRSDLRPSMLA